jgi:hypothetical protein
MKTMARLPREEILSFFSSVMPDLSCNLDNPRIANNRHQLFGNRVRSQMLALTEIKEDCAWEATMPHPYRWLIQGLTWPLAIPLGYYRRRPASRKPG